MSGWSAPLSGCKRDLSGWSSLVLGCRSGATTKRYRRGGGVGDDVLKRSAASKPAARNTSSLRRREPCFVPSCFHRLVVFVSGDGRNQKPDISRSQRPTRQDCSRAPWCWQRFCFPSPGRRVAAKALSWYPSVLMKLQDVVRNLEKSMSAKRSHCQQRSRDLFATPKPRSWFSRGGRRSHFKSGETTSSGRGNERRREADVRLGDVVDWRVEVS